ncbi:MAG: helix-turn-helix domain-containing protein [Acidimicrobiales bacterium]
MHHHSDSSGWGAAPLVLLKIADNCDDAGNNAWPSHSGLARYCRCTVSTVHRSITELEELGEFEVVHKADGKHPGSRYAPNLYRAYPQGGHYDRSELARDRSNSVSRPVESSRSDRSAVYLRCPRIHPRTIQNQRPTHELNRCSRRVPSPAGAVVRGFASPSELANPSARSPMRSSPASGTDGVMSPADDFGE